MEVAPPFREAADRMGLDIEIDAARLRLRRHDWAVTLRDARLAGADSDDDHRHLAAWILQGVRLGLDARAKPDESTPYEAPKFRRANVDRYEEAESVHGDRLPLLVPAPTRRVFEEIADDEVFGRPWLQPDLELLVVRETGIRLEVLTADEHAESDYSDDKRWSKARSALFYQSYRVRPSETIDVDGGQLRIIETREGFGATRAVLLPEFDYDASREHGYLAVPSRDRIIIARPDDQNSRRQMLPALEDALDRSVAETRFGMTDAIFELHPQDVTIDRRADLRIDPDGRPAVEFVGDITPP